MQVYQKPDFITFSGQRKAGEFEAFIEQYRSIYGEDSSKPLYLFALDDKKRLGEGTQKIVYEIPGLEDFVVGKLKNEAPHENAMLHKTEDFFTDIIFLKL